MNYFRLVFIIAAFIAGASWAMDPGDFGFMHRVDLVFHEAGHIIFGIFGVRDLTIFGGTLMQLLVPATFVAYFFVKGQRYSSAVVLVWLAQSFADCVPYIKDARTMDMILLGGLTGLENGAHDWNNLLFDLDMLHYDQLIGNIFYGAGIAALVVSLIMGVYYSRQEPEAI